MNRSLEPGKDFDGCRTILAPGLAESNYWRDVWRYHELFLILAWRDIAVRYRQTVIGASWALVRPFLTMVVFTIVFGKIANLPSDGQAPYELMVLAGILPWMFFSTALGDASNSLVGNAGLISKVYFPRMIIPTAAIVVSLIDLLVGFVILFGVMLWFNHAPDWRMLFLPAFILLGFLAALGPALWVTAANVKYRDFRYIVTFIIQFGLYVSPVGFSSQVVPDEWRFIYSINPMVSVIDGFRWCILGGVSPVYVPGFVLSLLIVALGLWLGIRQFRRMEKTFADLM